MIIETIKQKRNIFWCGNGGSASDSMHLSAEFNGKLKGDFYYKVVNYKRMKLESR